MNDKACNPVDDFSQKPGKSLVFKRTVAIVFTLAVSCLVLTVCGCGSKSNKTSASQGTKDPLHQMRYLSINGQMQEAWAFSDEVLAKHGTDPKALQLVARVAHANQHPEKVADLLPQVCELESYANEQHVQQSVVALIGVGRLIESIDFLEKSVKAQPSQVEPRRLLYDFYVGTENRPKSLEHGRHLVRHRHFDLPLLMNLGNTERRALDSDPLAEVIKRNPKDKRPKIGSAKVLLDRGELEKSIVALEEILAAHPDFLPAQALMCAAYVASNRMLELESFVAKTTDGIQTFPAYWLAMGDWASENDDHEAAARSYWEATRADPDHAVSWVKLNKALQLLPRADSILSEAQRQAIQQRASLLSRFNQHHHRFERSGKVSREIAIEIAETLVELGRPWAAEAWSAIAMTLPEDESVPAEMVRQSIVATLTKSTPWQIRSEYPEFNMDLSKLHLASLTPEGRAAPAQEQRAISVVKDAQQSVPYRLVNEAQQRGIHYFGRTHEKLHEPGIMLHRTLGCGGGAIDFDLDGWSDLYLVTAGGTPPKKDSKPNALYRNLNGLFSQCGDLSNTDDTGYGQGVTVGDINADGFPDLLVLNYGPNTLLINNGDGTFTDATQQWFSDDVGNEWSTSGAIADLDDDGIPDLVVLNYCAGLEPATVTCPMKGTDQIRSCTPMLFSAATDNFFQGSGAVGFVDRTDQWKANPDVPGRGLGVSIGNFDSKSGLDILIANDMTNNHYWSVVRKESGAVSLSESAMLCGLGCDDRAVAQGSMGIATGDFDRDGDIDFYVTNFHDEYNTYHDNRGKGVWQDFTKRLKLSAPTLPLVGFGTEAVDFDNDGELEIVLSNGHVDMFSRDDEKSVYDQPMQIFRRDEQNSFQSVGELMTGEYVSKPHVGRALWTIDANNDGKQDLVVTHQTEPAALLINHSEQQGNWIRLYIQGTRSDRNAVGTAVRVSDSKNGSSTWTAGVLAGDGYLCSNEDGLTFGVAKAESLDLEVTWPGGVKSNYAGLEANRAYLIVEGLQEIHSFR